MTTRAATPKLAVALVAAVLLITVVPVLASAAPSGDDCSKIRAAVATDTLVLDAAQSVSGPTTEINQRRKVDADALRACAPGPTPTPTVTTTPTGAPSPTPGPTSPPGAFPGPDNTGVPDGTALTTYTGPCMITAVNTVIDAKIVNCDLEIRTTGVQVRRSRINGTIATPDGSAFSFTLTDSNVDGSPSGPRQVTGVGADNFTMLRTEVVGGNRGVHCRRNCEVRDSWVHGTEITSNWHASAVRASQSSRIIHNTLACDTQPTPQDGGCSADLTMYGDFEPVQDVLAQDNLFVANPTGNAFCAYGGSSAGKPFSGQASGVRFINNTFQRGSNGKCGAFAPIDSFDPGRPGNVWSGNVWDNGGVVPPT